MATTVFLAGDSTMANYTPDTSPQAGWGQMLQPFLPPHTKVVNGAMNGRSSKSFIEEGRLALIQNELSSGDFLLIQFGHNDSKEDPDRHTDPFTSYKEYLAKYIQVAIENKATPILLSPVARRTFDLTGKIQLTHGDYPVAVKELAEQYSIPFIDLTKVSGSLLQALGQERSKDLFMWLKPNEHSHYPDGIEDNTHFNEEGAKVIANLVVSELKAIKIKLG